MKLPERVIERVKELAEGINYGSITIRISQAAPNITVSSTADERYSTEQPPAPGVVVAENQVRRDD